MGTPRAGGPEELREEECSEINGLTENGEGSEDEGSEPTVHSRRWVHVSGNDEASSSSEEGSDNGGQDLSESDEDYAAVLERFAEIMALRETNVVDDLRSGEELSRLERPDIDGIADYIRHGKVKNIICMCGAGISVSAGIPDFRSPGTGLYSRLESYNLPHPQAVFEIDFFTKSPEPFYMLAKELYPGSYKPTTTHYFMKLLHDKGLLKRCYTQNIDSLESLAGLPKETVIAAHGNFDRAHCIKCRLDHDVEYVKLAIEKQKPCRCLKTKGCYGLVKPGIVFFGESLPERFWKSIPSDFEAADLLIVMGSSLVVQPFASLIDKVKPEIPRVLINREIVGETPIELKRMGYNKGFDFQSSNRRDVALLGDCDDMVIELCKKLDWHEELEQLMSSC